MKRVTQGQLIRLSWPEGDHRKWTEKPTSEFLATGFWLYAQPSFLAEISHPDCSLASFSSLSVAVYQGSPGDPISKGSTNCTLFPSNIHSSIHWPLSLDQALCWTLRQETRAHCSLIFKLSDTVLVQDLALYSWIVCDLLDTWPWILPLPNTATRMCFQKCKAGSVLTPLLEFLHGLISLTEGSWNPFTWHSRPIRMCLSSVYSSSPPALCTKNTRFPTDSPHSYSVTDSSFH